MKKTKKKKPAANKKSSAPNKKAAAAKGGRKRYVDDYKLVGKALVYYGDWYVLDGSAKDRRRYNLTMTALACVAVLSAFAPGFTHIRGMFRPYVIIPYVVWAISAVMCVIDAVKVWNAGEKLNREQYDLGAKRIKYSALVLLCAGAASLLGQAVYLVFFDGGGSLGGELLFELCAAIGAGAGYAMFRTAKTAVWKIKKR